MRYFKTTPPGTKTIPLNSVVNSQKNKSSFSLNALVFKKSLKRPWELVVKHFQGGPI